MIPAPNGNLAGGNINPSNPQTDRNPPITSPSQTTGTPNSYPQPPAWGTPKKHKSNPNQTHYVKMPLWIFVLLCAVLAVIVVISLCFGTISTVQLSNTRAAYAKLEKKYHSDEKIMDALRKLANSSESSDDSDDSGDDSDSSSSDAPEDAKENQNQVQGATETNGTLKMRFDSVEYPSSIPNSDGEEKPITAQQGRKLVQVNTYVTNNGKSPIDLTCSYEINARLINDKGQSFTPIDDDYKVAGNPECNFELQAGTGETMKWVYEIPQDSQLTGLIWQDVTDMNQDYDYSSFIFDKNKPFKSVIKSDEYE